MSLSEPAEAPLLTTDCLPVTNTIWLHASEPIIPELEREQNDPPIIAHESVLRVLYTYQMHCSTMEIPNLKFPRDEIIEIMPAAYQNEAKRIHIPGLDPKMVNGSPEDIRIPVVQTPIGHLSPIPRHGQPSGANRSFGHSPPPRR